MADLNVTFEQMRAAARDLKGGQTEIEEKLRSLNSKMQALVTNGYVTASSSKAFDASYQEYNVGAGKTINGLDGISNYLTGAADALQNTDQELANALKK